MIKENFNLDHSKEVKKEPKKEEKELKKEKNRCPVCGGETGFMNWCQNCKMKM